jgi:hypothetical protein
MHNPIEKSNDRAQVCVERMRQLPTEMLPPYNWQEFQRRARQRLPAASNWLNWRHMAAAAALLLVVCAIAVWGRIGSSGQHVAGSAVSPEGAADRTSGVRGPAGDVDGLRERQATASDVRASRAGADAQADDAALAARAGADAQTDDAVLASHAGADARAGDAALAAIRSRAIESWLATLPREPVVVRVGTRAAVARLEDRIAQVDDLLTSVRLDGMRQDRVQDRLAALQQERVRLVGSLAQVRYAEVVASESP